MFARFASAELICARFTFAELTCARFMFDLLTFEKSRFTFAMLRFTFVRLRLANVLLFETKVFRLYVTFPPLQLAPQPCQPQP